MALSFPIQRDRQGLYQVRFSAAGPERSISAMRHHNSELMKRSESSNFEMNSGEGAKLQGRAKKILLSSVTHVPSGLIGCALAG